MASGGLPPANVAVLKERVFPLRITGEAPSGRAMLERAVVHIPDLRAAPEYRAEAPHALEGFRTMLVVPMLREEAALGTITLLRREVRPFSDAHIEMVKTFADQAVIAIENVRLFTELRARSAELSRSVGADRARRGEPGPQLDAAPGDRAGDHCRADQPAGRARTGAPSSSTTSASKPSACAGRARTSRRPSCTPSSTGPFLEAEGILGRAATLGEPVQIPDISGGDDDSPVRNLVAASGYRALLAIPFLREEHFLGGLVVNRKVPGAFPPEVVHVLTTFATQCALAIQNARLFGEVEDKTRELEVATRHKSEFLANMSHELRTPLNAVIGFSEVLLERMFGDLNDKQEEYLNDILGSGRHLLALINDILDLSKIEAGRMELDMAAFDLPGTIEEALTLVRERAARRAIALGAAIDERLGAMRGDQRKIKQVLLNLLSNAVKFTPEGGRVDVQAERVDGHVEIAVSDTGIGIAPEDQEAVFEEFRQVGSDVARKREGTGLGLALARRFVELHGGRIWVKSAPGEGSTFTLSLPVLP